MIKKHITNNCIHETSLQDLIVFIQEMLQTSDSCLEILSNLEDRKSNEIDKDELVEILEESVLCNTSQITFFRKVGASQYTSLNQYLGDILDEITCVNDIINKVCSAGIWFTDEQEQQIQEHVESIIGGIAYVLWYEFDLETYLHQIEVEDKGVDADIDVAYKSYVGSFANDKGAYEIAKSIRENKIKYKFKLKIFDENPELEEPFENLMGPFLAEVIDEFLTLDLVKDLLDGRITPEGLITILKNTAETQEDSDAIFETETESVCEQSNSANSLNLELMQI